MSYITKWSLKVTHVTREYAFYLLTAIGPASYVINAADLSTVTDGNLIFKYADDTYIIIPAANVNSKYAELDHVGRWAQNNNLTLKSLLNYIHRPQA